MSTDAMTSAKTKSRMNVRQMAQMGMLFEIPLPFAPAFYEIDFSEVPVMVGCFTMGPLAGAVIEFLKILLNFAINGTDTAGVGELSNFLIGCSLVVPAAIVYKKKRTRAGAVLGMVTGTAFMTVVGCFLNALIGMGAAVNGCITNLTTFAIFAVAPFNLLKGFLVSVIVLLIYKKISPILKNCM